MEPRPLKSLCQGTSAAATGKRNSNKPKKYSPPIDGGSVGFRKVLSCEKISGNTFHIIKKSRGKDTLSSYKSACKKWASLCLNGKLILFRHL